MALIAIAGCDRSANGSAPAQPRAGAPVTVAPAVARDVPLYLDEIGNAAASNAVIVTAQVGGQVMSVHFDDGAFVKKGDLLFTIDPRPFKAALDQAQASLAVSKAQLDWAQRDFQFVKDLEGSHAVSQEEFVRRENAILQDDASVKAAEASVEAAQLNLDYCTVRAPFDGRAGRRLVDPGNVVKANEGQLVSIQALDPIYATFTVTEADLPRVREYSAAGTLQCLVSLPGDADAGSSSATTTAANDAPSAPRIGQLTFLDNAVQTGSGTVQLRATVANADHHFWPGQFVRVRLVLKTLKDAVLVPVKAQQVGQQGAYVYTVEDVPGADGKSAATVARIRQIVPGQRHGDLLAIEQGLRPGERVVVTGQMQVAPDGPVTILPDSAAPAAGHS